MIRRLILAAALVCGCRAIAATSTPYGFTDDLDAALKSAQEGGKLVYVCFSGSDWCHWCVELDKTVFASKSFTDSLKDKYEFVFIDTPADPSRLSVRAKEKNPGLTKKFAIRGFPSMVILNGAGAEVTRGAAFRSGGVAPYVEFLQEISKDPEGLRRKNELEKELFKPLQSRYYKILHQMESASRKAVEDEMKKPENKGKSPEAFRSVAQAVVQKHLAEFEQLQRDADAKAAAAPAEIKETLVRFAASVTDTIEKLRKN